MLKPPPPAEEHDFLADNNAYAGLSDSVSAETDPTHLGYLLNIRRKLVTRRRQLAADAHHNPVVYLGRAIDICKLQELLRAIDEAIKEERGSGG